MTLATVLAVLQRRRGWLVWPLAGLLMASLLSCLLATKRFRATAEIQIQKESGAAGLASSVSGQPSESDNSDSLDYTLTLQTEAAILRSPALALAVIAADGLEPTADYFPQREGSEHALHLPEWLTLGAPLEPLTTPIAEAPNRRAAAEKIFKSHLKVQPTTGTRLIDLSYSDPDPARAALVANTAARVLADMMFEQSFTATAKGTAWLEGQLAALRAEAEQATARAAALERGTGVFGADASRNIVLERLDSLNQTLTAAESNRLLKESIDRVAASGSPELISSLSGNSTIGSVASINTSLSLIQGMRQQEAQTRAELAEASVRYGPAYPRVAELKAQLAGISSSIALETTRLGQRAHTDWQIAEREEAGARAAFEAQKKLATRQNDAVIAYGLARQEADNSRELYEGLLAKLKQTSLLAGLRANNVSIVSPAEVPPAGLPASPNILLRLALGLGGGLLVGMTAAAWAEMTDPTIVSLHRVERELGASVLAVVPTLENGHCSRGTQLLQGAQSRRAGEQKGAARKVELGLTIRVDRSSPFEESLRALGASLQGNGAESAPRVVLVTSSLPAEGKTVLALNLAILLAEAGRRVLLVGANLRCPALYDAPPIDAGLALALSGPATVRPRQHSVPNLHLLAGQELAPFPAVLLGSPRMTELIGQWRTTYDLVVLDAPPVLPVGDAFLLARHSDAVLLVARHRQTSRQALQRSVDLLSQGTVPRAPVGVIVNGIAQNSAEYRAYFGYAGGVYGR